MRRDKQLDQFNEFNPVLIVTASEGIASNDNDTTVPTSAAVKAYADSAGGTPTVITVADTADATAFVALFESATGDLAPKTDTGLTYDATTGTLTATALVGPLTGNVTGNASGTAATVTGAAQAAITSATALPWTGLKVGVNGEIPTFDASGNPAFVAVGTATHVLTSNGVGAAPTFQAAAGGGFADWKTIGTGGDYADVQAMIADSQYKGYLLSAVTEDSDITPDANGLFLHLNDFVLTMGANNIVPSAACSITIVGWSPSVSEIDYTATVANEELIDTGAFTTSVVVLANIKFDNNSSAAGCYLQTSTSVKKYTNLIIECSNQNGSGITAANNEDSLDNIAFVGGGASCLKALAMGAGGTATNLQFSGTYSGTMGAIDFETGGAVPMPSVSNINILSFLGFRVGGQVSNVKEIGGTLNIEVADGDCLLTNFECSGTFDIQGSDKCLFSNGIFSGTVAIDDIGDNQNHFSNCQFEAVFSLTGGNTLFSNCRFDSTSTIISDNDLFNNCIFTGAFTVNAGADNLQFIGCYWDGNVSITSNNSRYEGYVNTANTFTLASTATNNKVDVTIDQAVVDSSGNDSNSITEMIY